MLGRRIASRHELLGAGAAPWTLTEAVRLGALIRVRRDHYALPGTAPEVLRAVRVGGRLACTSALALNGVFADDRRTHVHLDRAMSRMRHPERRAVPHSAGRGGALLHWQPLLEPADGDECSVGLIDALAQTLRCQRPWWALASIDNALNLGLLSEFGLAQVFDGAPDRSRQLRRLVDGRAEAGQETVLRMIVRSAGLRCEPQVTLEGLGRVDLLVEGCLVLEADSRLAHDGWELHVRDRDRDLAAARLGLMTLRPVYQRTMRDPAAVRDAVVNLVAVHRRFRRVL